MHLPERRSERVAQLGIIEIRTVDAVARTVVGRQQRLELRVAFDEPAHEVEGAERRGGGPVEGCGEEAFGERGRAPGRRRPRDPGGPGREREVQGAEEQGGRVEGLDHGDAECGVGGEGGERRVLDGGHQRQRGE